MPLEASLCEEVSLRQTALPCKQLHRVLAAASAHQSENESDTRKMTRQQARSIGSPWGSSLNSRPLEDDSATGEGVGRRRLAG